MGALNNLINGQLTHLGTGGVIADAGVPTNVARGTINDATLTIQRNGTAVDTFTSNQATASIANITVPTGALASLNSVNATTITDNSVGAAELNVSGNGTNTQFLRSDGDGSFTWAAAGGGTPTDGIATGTVIWGRFTGVTNRFYTGNYTFAPRGGGNFEDLRYSFITDTAGTRISNSSQITTGTWRALTGAGRNVNFGSRYACFVRTA